MPVEKKRSASASSKRTWSPAAHRTAHRASKPKPKPKPKPKAERDPAVVPPDLHNAIDASLKNARAHNTNLILRLRREEKITAGTARLLLARWTKKMQWAVAYSANLFPPNLQILYKGKYPNGQRTDHHLSEEEILAEDADNLRKGIVPQFSHKERRAAARAAEEDDEEEEEDENFPGVPGDEEGPEYIVLGSGVGRASGDDDEEEEEERGTPIRRTTGWRGRKGMGATTWRWMRRRIRLPG